MGEEDPKAAFERYLSRKGAHVILSDERSLESGLLSLIERVEPAKKKKKEEGTSADDKQTTRERGNLTRSIPKPAENDARKKLKHREKSPRSRIRSGSPAAYQKQHDKNPIPLDIVKAIAVGLKQRATEEDLHPSRENKKMSLPLSTISEELHPKAKHALSQISFDKQGLLTLAALFSLTITQSEETKKELELEQLKRKALRDENDMLKTLLEKTKNELRQKKTQRKNQNVVSRATQICLEQESRPQREVEEDDTKIVSDQTSPQTKTKCKLKRAQSAKAMSSSTTEGGQNRTLQRPLSPALDKSNTDETGLKIGREDSQNSSSTSRRVVDEEAMERNRAVEGPFPSSSDRTARVQEEAGSTIIATSDDAIIVEDTVAITQRTADETVYAVAAEQEQMESQPPSDDLRNSEEPTANVKEPSVLDENYKIERERPDKQAETRRTPDEEDTMEVRNEVETATVTVAKGNERKKMRRGSFPPSVSEWKLQRRRGVISSRVGLVVKSGSERERKATGENVSFAADSLQMEGAESSSKVTTRVNDRQSPRGGKKGSKVENSPAVAGRSRSSTTFHPLERRRQRRNSLTHDSVGAFFLENMLSRAEEPTEFGAEDSSLQQGYRWRRRASLSGVDPQEMLAFLAESREKEADEEEKLSTASISERRSDENESLKADAEEKQDNAGQKGRTSSTSSTSSKTNENDKVTAAAVPPLRRTASAAEQFGRAAAFSGLRAVHERIREGPMLSKLATVLASESERARAAARTRADVPDGEIDQRTVEYILQLRDSDEEGEEEGIDADQMDQMTEEADDVKYARQRALSIARGESPAPPPLFRKRMGEEFGNPQEKALRERLRRSSVRELMMIQKKHHVKKVMVNLVAQFTLRPDVLIAFQKWVRWIGMVYLRRAVQLLDQFQLLYHIIHNRITFLKKTVAVSRLRPIFYDDLRRALRAWRKVIGKKNRPGLSPSETSSSLYLSERSFHSIGSSSSSSATQAGDSLSLSRPHLVTSSFGNDNPPNLNPLSSTPASPITSTPVSPRKVQDANQAYETVEAKGMDEVEQSKEAQAVEQSQSIPNEASSQDENNSMLRGGGLRSASERSSSPSLSTEETQGAAAAGGQFQWALRRITKAQMLTADRGGSKYTDNSKGK